MPNFQIIDFGIPILEQGGSLAANDFVGTDSFDYIWQYPDQGTFQRDPVLAPTMTNFNVTGVPLLVYNPVETLQPGFGTPSVGNSLVLPPQLANSSVALSGFWVMTTFTGLSNTLRALPTIRIINDRTLMFAQQPSVAFNNIDVSHINIVINIFGVYVRDGLQTIASGPFKLIDFGIPILEQ